jgi:hypothetical protein
MRTQNTIEAYIVTRKVYFVFILVKCKDIPTSAMLFRTLYSVSTSKIPATFVVQLPYNWYMLCFLGGQINYFYIHIHCCVVAIYIVFYKITAYFKLRVIYLFND